MRHWFSDYRGDDWSPSKGYNQNFTKTRQALETWFHLSPSAQPGYLTSDKWCKYSLQRKSVLVNVYSLKWNEYIWREGHIVIRFRVKVILRWDSIMSFGNFYDDEIIIEFPQFYPALPPNLFIERYNSYPASEDHHLLGGGRLCILTVKSEWMPSDNSITAVNAALDWIVLHYNQFGN